MMLEIKGKRILVVGLARSGLAVVRFLAQQGAEKIIANESKKIKGVSTEENTVCSLKKYKQVSLVDGGHPLALLDEPLDLIIKSPGVPPDLLLLQEADKIQIPVLTEIELAYHYIKAPIIGITGTNGKTTTTMLIGEIYKTARAGKTFVAGNLGVPLCTLVDKASATDTVVAELSSFQLGMIRDFRCAVAVILNMTEDHLDYHGSLKNYFEAKAAILSNQKKNDFAVINVDCPNVSALAERVSGRAVLFSRISGLESGVFIKDGKIVIRNAGFEQIVCPADEVGIPGPHNLENALAATAAAWAGGIAPHIIREALQRFQGVEHRLELIGEINGIKFVNDSKGTNPEAVIKALKSYPGGKVLIAGGKDKGGHFHKLAEHIKMQVSFLVLLGETSDKIVEAVERVGFKKWMKVNSLESAVEKAYASARPGETVLLSPACASWDMFSNFEERGSLYKKLVRELKGVQSGDKNT